MCKLVTRYTNKIPSLESRLEKMKYTPDNTKIAVIGGGNIGTQFACMCASKGYKVNLCSSKPELYDGILEAIDEFGNRTVGRLNKACSSIQAAIEGCSIIIVTHPAFRLKLVADQIRPFIKDGVCICVVPGTGGAEFAFQECIKKGATLLGLQRVPSVARLEQYGKRVRCAGLRSQLHVASTPNNKTETFSEFLSSLWNIPCKTLPNYLNITLTPSNPILHTTRLRTLFADYEEGMIYKKNPLFYGEWDDASSKLLIACDGELQSMIKRIKGLDLSGVKSLKEHYESNTVEAMTKKISSIQSLHNLFSPMKTLDGGWIPDFGSRYFTADFPYGLAIIESFAKVLGCDVPNIKETIDWYHVVTKSNTLFNLEKYGIKNMEDIFLFYQ